MILNQLVRPKKSLKRKLILTIVPLFLIGEILTFLAVGAIFYFKYEPFRVFTSNDICC